MGDQTRSLAGAAQAAGKSGTWTSPIAPTLPASQGIHQTDLYLLKGDLKAEGFIEIGVQGLLLDCGLLLLQPLAVLQQVDLHIGIWGSRRVHQPRLRCPGDTISLAPREVSAYDEVHHGVKRPPRIKVLRGLWMEDKAKIFGLERI